MFIESERVTKDFCFYILSCSVVVLSAVVSAAVRVIFLNILLDDVGVIVFLIWDCTSDSVRGGEWVESRPEGDEAISVPDW